MAWPIKKITIEEYSGWTVDILDLSGTEVEAIEAAYKESDIATVYGIIINVVQSWTLEGRNGDPLPMTVEGLREAPARVIRALTAGVFSMLNEQAFPKAEETTEIE